MSQVQDSLIVQVFVRTPPGQFSAAINTAVAYVDPLELEDVARDLWLDERLMPPDQAAIDWLRPISAGVNLLG